MEKHLEEMKGPFSLSPAEKYILEIKEMSGIKFDLIEGKEVVMLLGPTGGGKSVLLNKAAGAKLSYTRNPKNGNW